MSAVRSVILDFDGEYIRAGYAGDTLPWVATQYGLSGLDSVAERLHLCEVLQRVFVRDLLTKPKQHNVVVVERLLESRHCRDLLLSVLLRDLQIPAVSLQPDFMMTMLSSGVRNGIILNIGRQTSQAMCFVDNRPLMHTWKESKAGVDTAVRTFQTAIGSQASISSIERLFWEVVCADNSKDEMGLPSQQGLSPEMQQRAFSVRSSCLQTLLTGLTEEGDFVDEQGGLAGVLLRSLQACNHDVRLAVARNVIIFGPGASIPGLPEAVCATATSLAKEDPEFVPSLRGVVDRLPEQRLQVVPSPFPRSTLAWLGGSLFASLKESKATFATLQDLTTSGSSHVNASGVCAAADSSSSSSSLPEGYLVRAPDWQSLDQKDWVFCRNSLQQT